MITAEYCKVMARYNYWQNTSLIKAAESLDDTARWEIRGAFFGSIAATFNHLLWDDWYWLERFKGNNRPEQSVRGSLDAPRLWNDFKWMRAERDQAILAWASRLSDEALLGDVVWYPGGEDASIRKPKSICYIHFFNHQTHHRGQIHGMLTAAGCSTGPTDLPAIPSSIVSGLA